QECVPVACGSVTEARTLRERARAPRELGAVDEELAWHQVAQGRDHAGSPVTPLKPVRLRCSDGREPVDQTVVGDRRRAQRTLDPTSELFVREIPTERVDVPREAMDWAQ